MKNSYLKSLLIISMTVFYADAGSPVADWGFVDYIQADNNLAPFATFNVNEMKKADIPSNLNVLVQWDKPSDNKTWRYQVKKNTLIDAGSFIGAYDLGYNPVQEVIDMATWAKTNYNARQWCIVLWNHGSGVIDPGLRDAQKALAQKQKIEQQAHLPPWLGLPGMVANKNRGILFDDTQGTFVTNANLTSMFRGVSNALGAPVDVVGMDACFMAMIEVAYQLVGYVKYLVASQEVEPGNGWHYAGLLGGLSVDPAATTPLQLAQIIVQQYGLFYVGQNNTVTQSAIDINALVPLKNNLNDLVRAVAACRAINASKIKNTIARARKASVEFDTTDYIDMYSFYDALSGCLAIKSAKVKTKPKKPSAAAKAEAAYAQAVTRLQSVILNGKSLITAAVVANSVGTAHARAKGLSIYFPLGKTDPSYKYTLFAQDTNWDDFLAIY